MLVRREVEVGKAFSEDAFERAFAHFREMYNVEPQRVLCAPDVLARYCLLFERSEDFAHQHSGRVRHAGVPLEAAVLAAGTIALEGEVDEDRMGDW
jgi:hypothetical protein